MDDFEAFDAAAEKLLLTHNVKATELTKRLVKITNLASKDLPPLQVLYCGSYGGFGYSYEFNKFMIEKGFVTLGIERDPESESNSEYEVDSCVHDEMPFLADTLGVERALASKSEVDSRVRDVEVLAPFGQYVMDKWPQIAKLVKAYTRNDLGDQMSSIYMIRSNEKRLLEIPKIRDKIAAQPGKSDGETVWRTWDLMENEDYSKYAPSALKEMRTKLDGEMIELPIDIRKRRDGLLMTEAQYKAMFEFLKQEEVAREVEAAQLAKKPWYARESKKEDFSFTDAITHYGEDHAAVWKYQHLFSNRVMRFLLLHPEHTERLQSEGDDVDCTQKLGLCAASSRYCKLKIAEVPRLSEWRVSEYDGLEEIFLVGQ